MSNRNMEHRLRLGQFVIDPKKKRRAVSPELLRIALESIEASEADGDFIAKSVQFDNPVGLTVLLSTTKDDTIVYAQRPGQDGLTRFVMSRQKAPTHVVSVMLTRAADHPDCYILDHAFFGEIPEPEPWNVEAFRQHPFAGLLAEASDAF